MNRRACLLGVPALLLIGCAKPRPPTLTPRSAQVVSVSPSGIEVSVELDAQNPNAFPLTGSRVSAALELQDGTALGNAASDQPFSIPAEGRAAVVAKLTVELKSLAALAPYALTATPVPYRLRGSALIGGESLNVEVPFTIEGVLTPDQVVAAGLHGAGNLRQIR